MKASYTLISVPPKKIQINAFIYEETKRTESNSLKS